jgi:hypothetical protein
MTRRVRNQTHFHSLLEVLHGSFLIRIHATLSLHLNLHLLVIYHSHTLSLSLSFPFVPHRRPIPPLSYFPPSRQLSSLDRPSFSLFDFFVSIRSSYLFACPLDHPFSPEVTLTRHFSFFPHTLTLPFSISFCCPNPLKRNLTSK